MKAPRTPLECKDRRMYLMLVGPDDVDPELHERKRNATQTISAVGKRGEE